MTNSKRAVVLECCWKYSKVSRHLTNVPGLLWKVSASITGQLLTLPNSKVVKGPHLSGFGKRMNLPCFESFPNSACQYVRDRWAMDGCHGWHEGPVEGMIESWRADIGQDSVQQGLAQVLLLCWGHCRGWGSRLRHKSWQESGGQHSATAKAWPRTATPFSRPDWQQQHLVSRARSWRAYFSHCAPTWGGACS